MSATNNPNTPNKSGSPSDDMKAWADNALEERNSDAEEVAAAKFRERQRRRNERKKAEEEARKKAEEEERRRAEEARKAEAARRAEATRQAEEARRKAAEKRSEAPEETTEALPPCSGCVAAKVACTMDAPAGSKTVACDRCRRLKLGCARPGEKKKERRRKREEAASPKVTKKKARVRSPEETESEEGEDPVALLTQAIVDMTKEMSQMRQEAEQRGYALMGALEDLRAVWDPEYKPGAEEEEESEEESEEEEEEEDEGDMEKGKEKKT